MTIAEIVQQTIRLLRRYFLKLMPPMFTAALLVFILGIAHYELNVHRRIAFNQHSTDRDLAGLISGGVTSPGSYFVYFTVTFLIRIAVTFLTCLCYGYAWAAIAALVWNIRRVRKHYKEIITRALSSSQVRARIFRLSALFVLAQFCTKTLANYAAFPFTNDYGTTKFLVLAYSFSAIGLLGLSLFLSRYAFDIPLLLANVGPDEQHITLTNSQRTLRRNLFLLSTLAVILWTALFNIAFGKIFPHIRVFDSQTQARFLAVQIIQVLVNALPYAVGMVALTVATIEIAKSTVPSLPDAEPLLASEPSWPSDSVPSPENP